MLGVVAFHVLKSSFVLAVNIFQCVFDFFALCVCDTGITPVCEVTRMSNELSS